MNRSFPLLVLLMALPASAGDATHGKKVFTAACANCHVARPAQKDAPGVKPTDNLALWLASHNSSELRQWVKDPWAVNPKTRCDPRQLQPTDIDDLLSFLRGAKAPAPSAPAP
jgi:cytochrome c